MGCVASRIDKEERVQTCRERKKLMKQLVGSRAEFADSQLAYLKALKNTGVTLRQFTESESLELENPPSGLALPPSPPPPLPPSPPRPPPPPYSPDSKKCEGHQKVEADQEEITEIGENSCCTTSPPPTWDFLYRFGPSSLLMQKKTEAMEQSEVEYWEEANTEFELEEKEEVVAENVVINPHVEKEPTVELADDNSSMVSWHTKDTADMAMVVWRNKKTLAGIIRELDEYFLKASYAGKEIAVLMDISGRGNFPHRNFKENKGKRCNSAKVFSALSWSWSSKSLQVTRDAVECGETGEPCRPGAHCVTLDKIYAEEQRLYKEVKEEENTKLELERKSMLLQRQEDENYELTKTEKTRASVESLQSEIISLQQSNSRTCSSILRLIGEELHPQLLAVTSGMALMWRTMYEYHQIQTHISQQLNHLNDYRTTDPTTDYHRKATAQLEREVTFWYNSFCKLIRSQQEYIKSLCRWVRLTKCLEDDHQEPHCSSPVRTLCEGWQLALDRVPHKAASEAIGNLLSAVQSIALQHEEEHKLQRKCEKLHRKWQKELHSVAEMEMKLEGSLSGGDTRLSLSPKHPLSIKRTKTDALKKQFEGEKARHLNSINRSWAMTLKNLQTGLPNVFRALTAFANACSQAFEAVLKESKPEASPNGLNVPVT